MWVKLLEPHFIDGRYYERGAVLELPPHVPPTPDMLGLDAEARQRIPARRHVPVSPVRGFGPPR